MSKSVLPIIVISQFFCTSLWFAANGIMPALIRDFELPPSALSHLTSSGQFGFILGTFIFAILTISDRFRPSRVFFICAILGAAFNLTSIFSFNTFATLIAERIVVGFFLAGIYPVGMKIASDYYKEGLGKSLGFLVGALVLGTALPHFLRFSGQILQWEFVFVATSLLSLIGGSLILLLGDGPFRHHSQKPDLTAFFRIFRNHELRSAAFGYFGHMWELYAFWTFVPVVIANFLRQPAKSTTIDESLWSFIIIASGSIACVISGYISLKNGPGKTAFVALLLSGICCVISPMVFASTSTPLFLLFMLFWGMTVIADSPLFSTLVAQNAKSTERGTALTIVNGLGFLITILSIQLISYLSDKADNKFLLIALAIGPLFGLISLAGMKSIKN